MSCRLWLPGLFIDVVAIPMGAGQVAEIRALGPGRGAQMVLKPLLSDVPRALAVLLLLAQLPSWLLEASRLLGGVLLIYLAWRGMRRLHHARERHEHKTVRDRALDAPRSLALWLMDPVLYALWGTLIGPLLLASWRRVPAWGAAFLASLYGALVLGATLVYILIFTFRKHGLSLVRALSVLCMIIAVFLAFVQIWRGSEALIARFF